MTEGRTTAPWPPGGLACLCDEDAARLLDHCLARIAAEESAWPRRRSLLIVPETRKFATERRYLAQRGQEALLTAEVLSFPRLASRLLGEAGRPLPELLGEREGILVLERLLSGGAEGAYPLFHRLRGREAYMSNLVGLLDSFQRYGIDEEALSEAARRSSVDHSRAKLEQLAGLTRDYRLHLARLEREALTTRLDHLLALLEELGRDPRRPAARRLAWLREALVQVTGFGETRVFTPQELAILRALSQLVADMTVTCVAPPGLAPEALGPAWRMGAESARAVVRAIPNTRLVALPAIEAPRGPSEPVTVLYAETEEAEAEAVAADIREAVAGGQLRYRDIAVFHSQPGSLAQLRRVFERYAIPAYIDDRLPLIQTSLARFVLSVLALATERRSLAAVLACMRSALWDEDDDDAEAQADRRLSDAFENHCLAFGLDHQRLFSTRALQEREELLELRERRIDPLLEGVRALERARSAGEASRALIAALDSVDTEARLARRVARLDARGEDDAAQALVQCWDELGRLLTVLGAGFADDPLDARDLERHLRVLLQSRVSGQLPSRIDEVVVSPATRFDFMPVRRLYLMAASRSQRRTSATRRRCCATTRPPLSWAATAVSCPAWRRGAWPPTPFGSSSSSAVPPMP